MRDTCLLSSMCCPVCKDGEGLSIRGSLDANLFFHCNKCFELYVITELQSLSKEDRLKRDTEAAKLLIKTYGPEKCDVQHSGSMQLWTHCTLEVDKWEVPGNMYNISYRARLKEDFLLELDIQANKYISTYGRYRSNYDLWKTTTKGLYWTRVENGEKLNSSIFKYKITFKEKDKENENKEENITTIVYEKPTRDDQGYWIFKNSLNKFKSLPFKEEWFEWRAPQNGDVINCDTPAAYRGQIIMCSEIKPTGSFESYVVFGDDVNNKNYRFSGVYCNLFWLPTLKIENVDIVTDSLLVTKVVVREVGWYWVKEENDHTGVWYWNGKAFSTGPSSYSINIGILKPKEVRRMYYV